MSRREVFETLLANSMDGVPGVLRITRGNPTATFAAFAGSHGNEVESGLDLIGYVLEHPEALAPDVDLILAIGAVEASQLTLGGNKTRFIKDNMNRVPADLTTLPDENDESASPELRRVAALRRILVPLGIECVFDVHSTDSPSTPSFLGIVGSDDVLMKMAAALPTSKVISNVVPVQATQGTKTTTLSAAIEPKCALEVEVGQSGSEVAATVGLLLFIAWGRHVGVLAQQPVYKAVASVMAPDTSYRLADPRHKDDLAPVTEGDVLLRNSDGVEIVAPATGVLTWGPGDDELTDEDVAAEVWFLLQKQ